MQKGYVVLLIGIALISLIGYDIYIKPVIPPSGDPFINTLIKCANVESNMLVSVSDTYPISYWSFPEPDYAWKTLKDLGIKIIQIGGGTEGNVLHVQCNEQHPWGMSYDSNWAQNLENLLTKANSYGIKIVFHVMGSSYGTVFGLVAPVYNYGPVAPYSSIDNCYEVLDKLAGNNNLNHNFISDPRIAWWSPINEADISDATVRDWTISILQKIKSYGGKTSVCVGYGSAYGSNPVIDEPTFYYAYSFPKVIQYLGSYVDYLQCHCYLEKVIVAANNNPSYDVYTEAYKWFSTNCEYMVNGSSGSRNKFSLDKLMITEVGFGSGTWSSHMGTQTTTEHQQAQYIQALFDATKKYSISKISWHEPFEGNGGNRGFSFIDKDGTKHLEPYNTFKNGR
jgi:hypothetical protein